MDAPVIMVQMDDHKWTLAALEMACAEAATRRASVVLALLLPQSHITLANVDLEHYAFSETECEEIEAYAAIAGRCGVPLTTRVFAYSDLDTGLNDVADVLHADTVFAHIPGDLLPFIHRRHIRHLEHDLESHHHHLRTFELPVP
jgi:nucleotide-binding universal stress UspA family protein